jgi:hypothetical protein
LTKLLALLLLSISAYSQQYSYTRIPCNSYPVTQTTDTLEVRIIHEGYSVGNNFFYRERIGIISSKDTLALYYEYTTPSGQYAYREYNGQLYEVYYEYNGGYLIRISPIKPITTKAYGIFIYSITPLEVRESTRNSNKKKKP